MRVRDATAPRHSTKVHEATRAHTKGAPRGSATESQLLAKGGQRSHVTNPHPGPDLEDAEDVVPELRVEEIEKYLWCEILTRPKT